MKKLNLILLSLVILIAMLTGCSSSSAKVIDEASLINDVMSEVKFTDELVEVNTDDILHNLYNLKSEDIASYKLYVSATGAKAEEIAVFEANDEKSTENIMVAVKERIDDLKFSFEGYVPEELNSIDNAVVKQCGKYVILGIGSDYSTINSVFDKYTK